MPRQALLGSSRSRGITGNFAILVSQNPNSLQTTAVLQGLLAQFPTHNISENISKNSEFIAVNREISSAKNAMHEALCKRPFLTHLFSAVRTRSVLTDEF